MNKKTKILITVITVLMASVMLTGCGNPYKAGIKSLKKGEYAQAIERFEEAIDKEKNLADSYRGLGIALWEEKDYQGAFEAFGKAIENGTKINATFYSLYGNIAMQVKEYKKAVECYELAIAMEDISDELKKETRYNLIAAYEYSGDVDKALETLEKYIADYPDDEGVLREAQFLETR